MRLQGAPSKSPRNRKMETFSQGTMLKTDSESVEKRHVSGFWQGRPATPKSVLASSRFLTSDHRAFSQ